MTYDEKIEQARGIVGNEETFEAFLATLKEAGGTTDAALRACSWEDLQDFGLVRLHARQVAQVFRQTEQPSEPRPIRRITPARAHTMTPQELLEHYDPLEADNAVGTRLRELSQSGRFIVFNADGTVNLAASTLLLGEIRNGFRERTSYAVDERPQRTYRVGERPDQTMDENPLYPGRMLRPDDTCDQTNRSWADVSGVVRRLVYLATHTTHEINVRSLDDAHRIIDIATGDNAEDALRTRYQEASMEYDRLEAEGNLPNLKVRRENGGSNGGSSDGNSRRGGSSRREDPFGHRSY